jgi:hypothetical protein
MNRMVVRMVALLECELIARFAQMKMHHPLFVFSFPFFHPSL